MRTVNNYKNGTSEDQLIRDTAYDKERYWAAFGATGKGTFQEYPVGSRIAKAYETALDIRKFEIELYWKRSASFWVLVAGIAAGLGLLIGAKEGTNQLLGTLAIKENACLGLSLAGAVISLAWWMVNASSKFWQRNWEYQVDVLEEKVLGPLYRTVFSKERHVETAFFSVSDVNKWISAYLGLVFFITAIYFSRLFDPDIIGRVETFSPIKAGIIVLNVVFVWWLFKDTRMKSASVASELDLEIASTLRATKHAYAIYSKASKQEHESTMDNRIRNMIRTRKSLNNRAQRNRRFA